MKSHVDANYRFIAAYQEVNARIAQRQQALSLFITLVVSLIAALVALKPGNAAATPPIEWLLLGFPVASVCLALLNNKAERAITNLRRFLATMERLDNAHEHLPSYNTDPRWTSGANAARHMHDLSAAILVAGSNAIALGAAWHIYPDRLAHNPVIVVITLVVSGLALLTILLTPRWSYRPE